MATSQKIGLGRRKAAVARVYVQTGSGNIVINGRDFETYFPQEMFRKSVEKPLHLVNLRANFDIKINVQGGGIKGQAEAIALGISRALIETNAELRPALKAAGLLTRDARVVERKKPGLRKARKKEQYSKR